MRRLASIVVLVLVQGVSQGSSAKAPLHTPAVVSQGSSAKVLLHTPRPAAQGLSDLVMGLAGASVENGAAAPFDSGVISGLGIRNIGSAAMSGRIAAIAARAGDDGKTVVFVGSASGGVWRSLDSGTTFRPVFDRPPT